jgi:Recombination endonuclease VII
MRKDFDMNDFLADEIHTNYWEKPKQCKDPKCNKTFIPKRVQTEYCSKACKRRCKYRRRYAVKTSHRPKLPPFTVEVCVYKDCVNEFEKKRFSKNKYCIEHLIATDRYSDYENKKERTRNRDSFRKYGISHKDADDLRSNCKCCPICGTTTPKGGGMGGKFVIDHVKGTKTIRGVICGLCNSGIGHLLHNPSIMRSAILYLENFEKNKTIMKLIA